MIWMTLGTVSCGETGGGESLPRQGFAFPVGVGAIPEGFALVVSSNFDRRYQSGALSVIDLNQVEALGCMQEPGRCRGQELISPIVAGGVSIGHYASGVEMLVTAGRTLAAVPIRDNNQVVFMDLDIGTGSLGEPSLALTCSRTGAIEDLTRFPTCEDPAYRISFPQINDPFDVQWLQLPTAGGETSLMALVSFLRSNRIEAVRVPVRGSQDILKSEYTYGLRTDGTGDLAYSPGTDRVFASGRSRESMFTPVYYMEPSAMVEASSAGATEVLPGSALNLYPDFLGADTRSIDILGDGVTAAVLLRNPNLLAFLDMSADPTRDGAPSLTYRGHVVVGPYPSRVRVHGDLVFVTGAQEDTLHVVDAKARTLIKVLEGEEQLCRGPFDIGFYDRAAATPPIHWGLIACFEQDVVAVLDLNPDNETFLQVIAEIGEPKD